MSAQADAVDLVTGDLLEVEVPLTVVRSRQNEQEKDAEE